MLQVTSFMFQVKIIVGLGNPGEKYKHNRHNVGFMFIDSLFQIANSKNQNDISKFKYDKYLLSEVCEIKKEMLHVACYMLHEDLILAKPQTFMNKSGDAVKALLDRYVTSYMLSVTSDLIVVHDDLDIPYGKFKIQMQGPKAHNGLTDIQNKLQTMDFLRIRIGVDNRMPENRMGGEEYVLQNFAPEEEAQLPPFFEKIAVRLNEFIAQQNSLQI